MFLFGFEVPLWAFFIIAIVVAFVVWKLIKFAFTLLLVIVVFLVILFGLDYFHVFDMAQSFLANFL